jgi:hypothetical protein
MQTLQKNWKWVLATVIALLAIGFFAGRATVVMKTVTKTVPEKKVTDTIYFEQLSPDHSVIPESPVLPMKKDSSLKKEGNMVIKYVFLKVDTPKIIADYVKRNSYKKTLFNNENGKMTIDATVQYNLLQQLDYSFTPIQKQTTIEEMRIFTPFVTGSVSSFGIGIGGGIYYYNVGISAKYLTNFKNTGYEIGLNVKF